MSKIKTNLVERKIFGNLSGCGRGYTLASILRGQVGGTVVIVPDSFIASRIEDELSFFLKNDDNNPCPILSFPDWETLPYDSFSPHQDIISKRLSTLYQLQHLKRWVLVVPMQTLMHRLCPKEYLLKNSLVFSKGDLIDLKSLRLQLEASGYICTPQVMEHGEFSVRGSILDLFPMGSDTPYRLDLFDNEIDTIRTFDIDTQRSIDKIENIRLLPAKEFPLTSEAISSFRTRWRDRFEGDPRQSSIYLDVTEGHSSPGLEYYLPLFFEQAASLFDYLLPNSLMVTIEGCEEAGDQFIEQVKERYEQYRHDRLKPILDPKTLFLQTNEVFSELKQFLRYELTQKTVVGRSNVINKNIEVLPILTLESRQENPLKHLEAFLKDFQGRLLFTAESSGRREIFKDLLAKIRCYPKNFESWFEFTEDTESYGIAIASLEEGMRISIDKTDPYNGCSPIAVIPETSLLGKRVLQSHRRVKQRLVEADLELRSLGELSVGGPVVHIDHGIGRYSGLTHLTLSDQEGEFVTLEYAGGDKLYVPVFSLHLLSRYSGIDVEHAPLHRLGTAEWQKVKRKVLEQTRDAAAELLEIYAKRQAKSGSKVNPPDEHYATFSAEFPYEETTDQKQAIEEVISDLITDKAMDRVICGDVGFGKTEVALRAAFLVVHSGKQVAVLVPTTLLAQQHYQTFTDRFARFPIRIEVVSRFKTRKEQESIISEVKEGKVDILIGTHKILQEQVQFKSLGLLVVDEEHRFGVRQKEAFKALRSEVDILTLTATPIPRTLNMAMSGIRDLSIIATPPAKRLSVKTFVREKNLLIVQEAILRELHRGGQVYYVHNFVETIDKFANELQDLVPTARIAIAHGQMRERELEQIMLDFYHRRYNILVCTTIIETGIDVPTANTIIIDRADKFGLAQLHQLRGRVGRSHHQAYAFCLTPSHSKITPDAKKRLEVIGSLDALGAGFTLATHDLEIRGAGELLGEEQSGNIQSVGFSLYMELLDHAVKALRSNSEFLIENLLKKPVEIDLHIPAFIPEDYLPDIHSRLVLYKRISNAKNKRALEDIKAEMIDRFGMLPEQACYLLSVTELRLIAEPLGIIKIEASAQGGRLEFDAKPNIDPLKIMRLIQEKPSIYQLDGPQKLRFRQALPERQARVSAMMEWVVSLAN
jgi:transcription-repair coupling factor (superfamily II helicase)